MFNFYSKRQSSVWVIYNILLRRTLCRSYKRKNVLDTNLDCRNGQATCRTLKGGSYFLLHNPSNGMNAIENQQD